MVVLGKLKVLDWNELETLKIILITAAISGT